MTAPGNAKVAIVMRSQSDWETMTCAAEVLDELGVATDVRIVSAHPHLTGCMTSPRA